MLHHLLETDQRLSVPGIGRWVIDGDEGGVTVFFHGQLVSQVEDAGLIGL